MKNRNGHVTNSSSSSFIIKNKTDKSLTTKEVVMALMEKILADCKNQCDLEPGEEKTIVCGDHLSEDGAFEVFIHNHVDNSWDGLFENDLVEVKFEESYH